MGQMAHQPAMLSTLRVTLGGQTREFADPVVTVGRDAQASISLPHPDVSRRHAEFRRTRRGWLLVDLDSTNGTWLGDRLVGQELLPPASMVMVGGTDGPRFEVKVLPPPLTRDDQRAQSYGPAPSSSGPPAASELFDSSAPMAPGVATQPWYPEGEGSVPQAPPGQLAHGQTVIPSNQPYDRVLSIGRSRTCDIVIDDPLVSRQHATIVLGQMPILEDLGSFNGTFVNGDRITSQRLHDGDRITIGRTSAIFRVGRR